MTLLAGLADARPEWQLILVGPVIKIGVADLPQRPNIHYLGQQPYADLPSFLAGWDVCLLPFARNESTRFISPTKTLEYMGAELPIVSTDIADVIELYGEAVAIARDANEFIAACESALQATRQQQTLKIDAMRRLVATSSWENTAEQMRGLLGDAAIDKRPQGTEAGAETEVNPSVADREARLSLPNLARMILKTGRKQTDR